jgi:hypothetical protein
LLRMSLDEGEKQGARKVCDDCNGEAIHDSAPSAARRRRRRADGLASAI